MLVDTMLGGGAVAVKTPDVPGAAGATPGDADVVAVAVPGEPRRQEARRAHR